MRKNMPAEESAAAASPKEDVDLRSLEPSPEKRLKLTTIPVVEPNGVVKDLGKFLVITYFLVDCKCCCLMVSFSVVRLTHKSSLILNLKQQEQLKIDIEINPLKNKALCFLFFRSYEKF